MPAPRRGEIVRQLGQAFRDRKEDLARLISLENGKILRGEVQEVIDICDFAVGLSRQLYGNQMHSERPAHRLTEQWHPLGVVGIISAFNFPVAVPGWGWALALVCGDTILWKPSELTPLVSIAAQQIFHTVTNGTEAEGVFSLVIGPGKDVGELLAADSRVPLVQATARARWADASRRWWANARVGQSWSWAATTPSSCSTTPTSIWRCARWSSARLVRPANAARARAG